jgi:uncharacterized membrane protein YfcA
MLNSFEGFPLLVLAGAVAGLFLGGISKGLLGIGLPLISVPLLITFLPAHDALAIMLAPTFVANFWQAFHGGHLGTAVRRFWPLLATIPIGVWAGTFLLVALNDRMLFGIVGAIVVTLSITNLIHPKLHLPARLEPTVGAATGAVAGLLLGIALHMGPLLALYFVSLKMTKDEFVRSLGVAFSLGIVFIAIFYVSYGVFEQRHIPATLIALIPVLFGNWIGQRMRRFVQEETFRKGIFIVLILIGANLIRRAIL